MKKTLSALIALLMLLPLCLAVIPASAATPEGKSISKLVDFYAMEQDGVYYLENSIEISAPYPKAFRGTLDGNGHVITSSSPQGIFSSVEGGTLKDLIIHLACSESTSRDIAAVATRGYGRFENIRAILSVEISASAERFKHTVGGIIGEVNGASVLENCRADGAIKMNISTDSGAGIATSIGGIAGRVSGAGEVSFIDCVNNANITSGQIQMSVGGIVGITRLDSQVLFDGCVNNGRITSTRGSHSGTAGICGIANGTHSPLACVRFVDCANLGTVRDDGEKGVSSGNNVGGILGRGYGIARADFERCFNAGALKSAIGGWSSVGGIIGGIMTYGFSWSGTHGGSVNISDCVNLGKIENGNFNGGIIGGALQFNTDDCMVSVLRSANYGDVSGENAGGIIGHCGESAFNGLLVKNCYNGGDIDGSNNSAGIVASVDTEHGGGEYAITKDLGRTVEGCINVGGAKSPEQFSGIISSVEKQTVSVRDCINIFNTDKLFNAISGEERSKISAANNYYIGEAGRHLHGSPVSESYARAREATLLKDLPADTGEMMAWLEEISYFNSKGYSEGWDNLVVARDNAKTFAYRVCSQSEADAALAELMTALEGLKFIDGISNEELLSALSEAEKLLDKQDEYTPASWEKFISEYERARFKVYTARGGGYEFGLIKAMSDLKIKATYDELNEVIGRYIAYRREEFTSAGWEEFRSALVAASELQDDENTSADDVSAAMARLISAAEALKPRVQTVELTKKLIETREDYPREDYTASSYAEFEALLAPIEEAAERNDCSAEEIEKLLLAIDEATDVLTERGDLSAVDRLLASIGAYKQNDFLPEGWATLLGVIDTVNSARERERAAELTKPESEALAEELSAALRGLIYRAEFERIDELLAEAENLSEADYTTESWAALESAIVSAKALKNDERATKEQSDAAETSLILAMRGLERIATGSEPSESGCGSSVEPCLVAIVAFLGACALVRKKID